MKHGYLQLLKFLSERESRHSGATQWTFKGLTEEDVEYLIEKNYIRVTQGKGYTGNLKFLHLTSEGQEFIEPYCSVCECLPCDCGFGSYQ
tara:strand:+ start:1667 stop:1936 length:270 start_codon:yes stop_codon:yes gene_type:complete